MDPNNRKITVYICQPTDRPHLRLEWIDQETGKRKGRSARTVDWKEAEAARANLEYELNHGLVKKAESKLSWSEFRTKFLAEYAAGLRDKARIKYETVFDVFEAICSPTLLSKINERVLSAFVVGMRERKQRKGPVGLAAWTQKNYLVALKTALGWAVEQGFLASLPTFPEVKVPKKRPQPIREEDWLKLYEQCPDDLWRGYLLCGWWAGLRLSEVWHLNWRSGEEHPWIDMERDRIILPAAMVKADEDQWVPIHPTLKQALEALPRTDPEGVVFPIHYARKPGRLPANGIAGRIIYYARKAGVKLSMHRLRKGFGCRVAQKLGKGNAPVLHRLMRHSSMQITMEFYANVDDVLDEAIKELS